PRGGGSRRSRGSSRLSARSPRARSARACGACPRCRGRPSRRRASASFLASRDRVKGCAGNVAAEAAGYDLPVWLAGWMWQARARRAFQRAFRRLGPVESWVEQLAPGRSFVDVGAMWGVHGKIAFLAEEHGATAVTAVDITDETPEYRAEHERRGSRVRFVRGDLLDPATVEKVGVHDVVWCSGLIYHVPDPLAALERLRGLTSDKLVLIGATVPELPGIEQASVFFPHLSERSRKRYDRVYNATLAWPGERVGLTTPFDPEQGYANWWWGLTPSSMRALLAVSGFSVLDTKTNGFHTRILAELA